MHPRPWLLVALSSLALGCAPSRPPRPPAPIGNDAAPPAPAPAPVSRQARLAALTPGHADGVYLGAPMAAVAAARPSLHRDPDGMDFRIEAIDRGARDVAEYTFYFATTGEHPLYEIIAQYGDAATAVDVFARDYQPLGHSDGNPDLPTFTLDGLDVPVRAWQFDDKVVVIAVLPGTEWDEDGD